MLPHISRHVPMDRLQAAYVVACPVIPSFLMQTQVSLPLGWKQFETSPPPVVPMIYSRSSRNIFPPFVTVPHEAPILLHPVIRPLGS